MSSPFDPKQGPILVQAEATGPVRSLTLQLILDTGPPAIDTDDIQEDVAEFRRFLERAAATSDGKSQYTILEIRDKMVGRNHFLREFNAMTILEKQPLILAIPLREDPPGVLRVGKSRVLLELVIGAHQRGASPREIVRMYDTLDLGDVFAVIAYYLAHPAEIDEYLARCEEQAEEVRRRIEAAQPPGPRKEELLARAKAKGLNL